MSQHAIFVLSVFLLFAANKADDVVSLKALSEQYGSLRPSRQFSAYSGDSALENEFQIDQTTSPRRNAIEEFLLTQKLKSEAKLLPKSDAVEEMFAEEMPPETRLEEEKQVNEFQLNTNQSEQNTFHKQEEFEEVEYYDDDLEAGVTERIVLSTTEQTDTLNSSFEVEHLSDEDAVGATFKANVTPLSPTIMVSSIQMTTLPQTRQIGVRKGTLVEMEGSRVIESKDDTFVAPSLPKQTDKFATLSCFECYACKTYFLRKIRRCPRGLDMCVVSI